MEWTTHFFQFFVFSGTEDPELEQVPGHITVHESFQRSGQTDHQGGGIVLREVEVLVVPARIGSLKGSRGSGIGLQSEDLLAHLGVFPEPDEAHTFAFRGDSVERVKRTTAGGG